MDPTKIGENLDPMKMGPKGKLTDNITDPNKKESWYSSYYDSTWRWIEDTYLKYFGENRTSYATKGNLTPLLTCTIFYSALRSTRKLY